MLLIHTLITVCIIDYSEPLPPFISFPGGRRVLPKRAGQSVRIITLVTKVCIAA